ncbi:hypothetical protein U1Q18_012327 [Sarracenia purpurea var. burkii]
MQLIFLMHLLSGYYLLYGFEKSPFLRSSRSKNNPGKAPKKIHKAEREKLKRENLNALFVKLSNTLDPAHQNNGKASILSNTIRLLRDLLAQVDSLKRENTALLSESHYVSTEKDELIEEKSTLETQIEELKSEVQQRIHSKSAWIDHLQPLHETASHLQEDHHHLVTPANDDASQPAPILGPMFVVPLHHHDLPVYHESNTLDSMSQLPSNISRPHARYPSSSDSWPSQILAKPSETAQIARISNSISSSSTNSRGD